MSELPKGWVETTIGVVALNVNNLREPISLKKRSEIQGQYPYYGATGQIDSLNDFTHEGEHILVGEDGANLLSKSKPLAFIATGKYWVNNHAHSLRSLANMPSRYLCLYINSLDLAPWVTGSAQPKLTRSNLDKIPLPLAPLAEQRRIVEKLDQVLAQVDTIKARLDGIPTILKRFRQSVLAAAVSGKLIGKVDLENIPLKMCVEIHNGARKPISASSRKNIKGDTPYYGATGVVDYINGFTHDGRFLLVGEDGANLLSKSKDLSFIVDGKVWVNNHAHVLKEKSQNNLHFIRFAINSLDLSPWVTGSAQPKLTKRALELLTIPKYSLEEQTEIVRLVDQYFAFADTIEKQVQKAQQRVDKLTQSILAKAFRGELVPQDPNDEPADELLKRIATARAEAEALAKAAKKATKKTSKKA